MDQLHLAIALGPLAVYFLLLGFVNLAGRPYVTSGARDLLALGIGISGFVIAGPMELFLPEWAIGRYGALVWLFMLAFHSLCLTLLVLVARPRLVIYNVSPEDLRPILAKVVAELDKDARWAGESLVMPRLGVQLHLEPFRALRNAQFIAAGPYQNFSGWRRLEEELAIALRQAPRARNPYGVTLLFFGTLMLFAVSYTTITHHRAVADALWEMLRL